MSELKISQNFSKVSSKATLYRKFNKQADWEFATMIKDETWARYKSQLTHEFATH